MDEFTRWYEKQGGTVDTSSMGLVDIPGQGRGAIAVKDIPKDYTIFSLPRSLTLSTRTSSLPELLGTSVWKGLNLDRGWVGLILCMMWEESRGVESRWYGYFNVLPKTFDTPMFWSEDELKEIKGTAIEEKIGRTEAEKDYHEKLIPALQARPDLFQACHHSTHYSLENYHCMGSRILSRSFHVERWEGESSDGKDNEEKNPSMEMIKDDLGGNDSMDIDNVNEGGDPQNEDQGDRSEGSDDDDDDNDLEDPSDVAMVPMADMLNARYGCENAKFFYEPTELKMITTKPIKKGEQIFNTYGDPPNSDLLRRYGHVDLVPLPNGSEGNPADIVELSADHIVELVRDQNKEVKENKIKERIDWWLEEGGDDIFILDTEHKIPDELVSFIKLLLLSDLDWEKVQQKSKPPKPKMDLTSIQVVEASLDRRLNLYPTSLEFDEQLLSTPDPSFSTNMRNSVIVRIGEKRIIMGCKENVRQIRRQLSELPKDTANGNSAQKKRKRDQENDRSKRNKH